MIVLLAMLNARLKEKLAIAHLTNSVCPLSEEGNHQYCAVEDGLCQRGTGHCKTRVETITTEAGEGRIVDCYCFKG